MKAMKYLILLFGLAISCQPEGFQDLTPENGISSHFAFNSIAFGDALTAELDEAIPDTVIQIDQPDFLISRSPFARDMRWYTTDTFAFDPGDFTRVLSVLTSTVEDRPVMTSYPASKMAPIRLGGSAAWSRDLMWIVPRWSSTGRWWIVIRREKVSGGFLSRWKYEATAVWMEGRRVKPKGDVS